MKEDFSLANEVQQRLEANKIGGLSVNPDEQRKYLGTFRERCYLSITRIQIERLENKERLEQHLSQFSGAIFLINGNLPERIQTQYIQLAANHHFEFRIVTTDIPLTDDSIALLLVSNQAVDEPIIDIEKKFGRRSSSTAPDTKQKKHGFFSKIFL